MKVVGLTGGIGSGKSTIAALFKKLGVSVYIADKEAKELMNENVELKEQIVALLGKKAYHNKKLNRAYIADKVFNDSSLLEQLNAIVHPAVAKSFNDWKNKQQGQYVIKEAAILFENEGYKKCDYTILVSAPEEIRIARVLKRDGVTRDQVLSRIGNQWDDKQKIPLADFVINNLDLEEAENQVLKIHDKITS
ncbi:dephospho-CoA kinase [Aquimarina sp. 2201CG5-10]|uniref:dephospho-CoA kinase n=1 Tax=Aquimarina callyspongiae TaxID=3098150 RepID=UPI002AB5CF85|nr:dephospho-CoA kinase [Aquimarina sp. 2201CG5-10]MDY8138260.1 dephospho-CoA kinase [Aquimarina sp. 2201CG5-10]